MDINEKIKLWIDITGVNPEENKKSWTINFNGNLSDYDIYEMNNNLNNVMKYDINGVYTNIFMKEYLKQFLNRRTIPILNYINNKDETIEYLNKCYKLNESFKDNEINERKILDEYDKIIKFYNLNKKEELNIFDICYIIINSKNNISKLNTIQLKRGNNFKINKPKILKDIYMIDNIDMLINSINNIDNNFISLVFIYDSDNTASSYFSFVIKNNNNVYLINDKPDYKHPNQKYMLRCQGREISDRINKTFFPYEITNIDIYNKYSVGINSDNLIKKDKWIKISNLSNLPIEESLWIIYMFNEIENKFFKNNYQCNELSYGGGMIQSNLLLNKETNIMLYDDYDKIMLNKIDNPENIELDYERNSQHLFDDIIDIFKDKVDKNNINLIGNSDSKEIELHDENELFSQYKSEYLILNINDFGTKESIEYRQKWLVRFNFAKEIDRLSKEDYDKNRNNVSSWYYSSILNNIDNILKSTIFSTNDFEFKKDTFNHWRDNYHFGKNRTFIGQNTCRYTSSFSDNNPSIVFEIRPKNSKDISNILNIDIKDFPIQIRNWNKKERICKGNQILENLDPCDWVIHDYWYRFGGTIDILMTKTEYNDLYKKYGLKPDKFWLDK